MSMEKLGLRGARIAAVVVLLASLAACRSLPGGRFLAGLATGDYGSGRISQQELREALLQYASRFEATIVASADTISAGTKDPQIQRRTLRWKPGSSSVRSTKPAVFGQRDASMLKRANAALRKKHAIETSAIPGSPNRKPCAGSCDSR